MPEQPQKFQYKRQPAVSRKINDINPETDVRVRIFGHVIDKTEGVLVVDDGSAKSEIMTDDFDAFDMDDLVRVFARVLPLENGYELRAEIIQKMNSMDMDLYRKVYGE